MKRSGTLQVDAQFIPWDADKLKLETEQRVSNYCISSCSCDFLFILLWILFSSIENGMEPSTLYLYWLITVYFLVCTIHNIQCATRPY
jgi:hypothetical protein